MEDKLRPFKKGESVTNKGGPNRGYTSTERTRTVKTPEGKWMNVNTLWKTHNGTTRDIGHKSDDFVSATARRYEERTKRYYPKYDTLFEAVAKAKARSSEGGSGSKESLTYIPKHGR